jgi:trans-aconitate 2-methyltransferase
MKPSSRVSTSHAFKLLTMFYTFGDHEEASRRLRRLAELYEPETRGLFELALHSGEPDTLRLAVDLGWTTQLLDSVLKPQRTVRLDSSERYIAEARANRFVRRHSALHVLLLATASQSSQEGNQCRFLFGAQFSKAPSGIACFATVTRDSIFKR